MNIASALLKQIIVQKDLDTWSKLKEHYLPGEYQPMFRILDKHIDTYQDLPKFEDLSYDCLLYTSPSPRDLSTSRMPSSA